VGIEKSPALCIVTSHSKSSGGSDTTSASAHGVHQLLIVK